MSIYNKIRSDMMQAKKDKSNMRDFYPYVIGLIENKASVVRNGVKTYPDDQVIALLKNVAKTFKENQEVFGFKEQTQRELEIVEKYLPKQLTEDEIKSILISSDQTKLPDMMKYLKENYTGLYDGKVASQIAKELSK